jgi:hypothetical protein
MANKLDKALKAYEKAHAWRELFALALSLQKSKEDILDMCGRVTGQLLVWTTVVALIRSLVVRPSFIERTAY